MPRHNRRHEKNTCSDDRADHQGKSVPKAQLALEMGLAYVVLLHGDWSSNVAQAMLNNPCFMGLSTVAHSYRKLAPKPSEIAGGQSGESLECGGKVRMMRESRGECNLSQRNVRVSKHCASGLHPTPSQIFSDAHFVVAAEMSGEVSGMDTADFGQFDQTWCLGEPVVQTLSHTTEPWRRLIGCAILSFPNQVRGHLHRQCRNSYAASSVIVQPFPINLQR
jgi:hypothetical protein